MRPLHARAFAYSVVGLLAVVALAFTRPLPARSPAAIFEPQPIRPVWTERVDTLGRGETLSALLTRGGIADDALRAISDARVIDMRRLPAGMEVTIRGLQSDTLPSEIVFQLAVDHLLRVSRTATGWAAAEERLPWTTDTIVVAGMIRSTLYEALDSAAASLPGGARSELAWKIADIYEYRVDMSRDLRTDDAFRVLVERSTLPNGAMRIGPVLVAMLTLSGSTTEAIRFESQKVPGGYFDQDGKSMRARFLRAPLAFRRISSVFGGRRHPVLGTWRQHKGIDYAASSGTPVRSIGDGTVIFAGRRGGYGNLVEIRHPNGFVSRYGHLRGFAKGTTRGARVGIGKTIGYVGMTGLATGPHLHFEVLVRGVQRNPRTALHNERGEPIPSAEASAFQARRTQLLARLDGADPARALARR